MCISSSTPPQKETTLTQPSSMNNRRLIDTTSPSACCRLQSKGATDRVQILVVPHVQSFFSFERGNHVVCNVCVRTLRYCGNTTNLVQHLRLITVCDEVQQRQSEEEICVCLRFRLCVDVQTMGSSPTFLKLRRYHPGFWFPRKSVILHITLQQSQVFCRLQQ